MPVRTPQAPWKTVTKQTLKIVGVAVANVAPVVYISQTAEDPRKDIKDAITEHSLGGTR